MYVTFEFSENHSFKISEGILTVYLNGVAQGSCVPKLPFFPYSRFDFSEETLINMGIEVVENEDLLIIEIE